LARGEEADRVVGLEMGRTITSPSFQSTNSGPRKALLRRAEPPVDAPRIIEIGSWPSILPHIA